MNRNPIKSTAKKKSSASKSVSRTLGASSAEKTVSIRKIANGYIVSESGYVGHKYNSKETFCEKPPTIGMEPKKD